MHFLLCAALLAVQLLPAKPAVQHVTLAASQSASGENVTLQLDVTPKQKIHVYGPGAKDYLQPTLKITPAAGLTVGKTVYPSPELVLDPILEERIPMYTKTFRVVQSITVKTGALSRISGVLTYQACDDTMCYAPASAPVEWVLR
jgi:DsbC/DsbD-like thiol-disulfide interchange protein